MLHFMQETSRCTINQLGNLRVIIEIKKRPNANSIVIGSIFNLTIQFIHILDFVSNSYLTAIRYSLLV